MTFSAPYGEPSTGAQSSTSTGCAFPDSALVQITVSGAITVTPNPAYTCCFSPQPNRNGVYGPMGGGSTSNWQQLFVRVPIIFGNGTATVVSGLSYLPNGHPAASVVVFEGSFVRRQGATVYFERYPIAGSGSCTTAPPPTPPGCPTPSGPAYAYSALANVLAGQQKVTVKRIARTLELVATPSPAYTGDSINFTASSTDGRSVSVREWIWQDTTGTTSSVGCSTLGTTCRFAPPDPGTMFVRARVGTNSFIEQASAETVILPVVLAATAYENPVVAGDSTTLVVTVTPARQLSSLSVSGGGVCDANSLRCRVPVPIPLSLSVSATLTTGQTITCSVSIDTLPCPTGNPDVDLASVRGAIDSLWKLGGDQLPDSLRRERVAFVIDSAGVIITRFLPADPAGTPCSTTSGYPELFATNWTTSTMKVVRQLHTHPINYQQAVPASCTGGRPNVGTAGRGPSAADWNTLYKINDFPHFLAPGFRQIVVEKDRVWSMDTVSSVRTVFARRRLPNGTIVLDTLRVPRNIRQGAKTFGYTRTLPLSPQSCLTLSGARPTQSWR